MALEWLSQPFGDSVQLVQLHKVCVPGEALIWLAGVLWSVHKSLMLAPVLNAVNTCTSGLVSQPSPTQQILSPARSADLSQPHFYCWPCCQTSRNQCKAWDHGRRSWSYGFSRERRRRARICQNKHGWCGLQKAGASSSREQSLLGWFLKMA